MEEAMMVVEETFKLVGNSQNDTYEFSLIFCMHGFQIDNICMS